jgi:PAS domain S-box-containing protein
MKNNDHFAGIEFIRNGSGEKHSKDALLASEQHTRRMLDMLPGFVWTARPDGEIEYSNQNILDYTGMTLAELKENWRSIVHPDDIAVREKALDKMARSGEPVERQLRVRRFDGVYRWFHTRMRALRDDNGQVLRWYCISWDIEEQKRAEEALRESEHRLRLIIDTVPALVWVAKPDGSVEYSNRQVVDYFGVPEEKCAESRWVHTVHPDDADDALRGWLRAVEVGASYEATHRYRRADGKYRWFHVRGEPLRDREGRILHWYGVLYDIDDRKRAEESLRESEQHLRLIVETIPALVWRTAPDGDPDYVNQRLMNYTGKSLQDFVHSGWTKLIHSDDLDGTLQAWSHAIEAGGSYQVTQRIRSADGAYRWFDVRGEPLRDKEGRVVHWYGLNIDIDDRKRIEETLRNTQARLSRAGQIATVAELSAAIAHEINQPLAAVVANGSALRRWLSSVPANLERARLIAERIIRDGNSAAEVVRRIRALFKQEAPTKAPLDINEVIAEVLRLASDEIQEKNIWVETGLEENLPMTSADRIQIQQVLMNLVRNAIEAMQEIKDRRRLLSIRSRRDTTNIIVEIRDHGRGLENAEKIFDPFFTTKTDGMGMGLAISRSIIEAHDGRLSAITGKDGTTFSFTLPIRSRNPE